MDTRPEKLLNLAKATRANAQRLEAADMSQDAREEAQLKVIAEAVVQGFDILFRETLEKELPKAVSEYVKRSRPGAV
jgi:GrpB-like predicted nucleotidyltransferase (UPF0157 family)